VSCAGLPLATSCLPLKVEETSWSSPCTPRCLPLPFFPHPSHSPSSSRAGLRAPSSAVTFPRRSTQPRLPPSSPPAPPPPPLPSRPANRAEAPGNAADAAVFSAGTDRRRAEIHRRRHLSGQATTSGEPRVSWRTPWTFFPFPLMAGAAAGEPAGSLLAMAELPSSWPAWPVCRWAMGPSVRCLGQLGPCGKSSCCCFYF
jgi:hypothetical protein